ncbi:MAG: alpha-hydroxy-acid oxidizing protein [Euryarchaeota archaeon]|nr:alpha-hydroxy-acid oxidizing protein [Euryarchaeota archaeon]MDE1836816.1 alpha-hydroxy-acid oxidizing protein [Euryarchaeota archaeon]MDE1881719.1 alpha-hydroxy-acid oxidizing protein [Euryarchaeota archaeon]MDE2044800.1 alpha-hydroxy-acid oxidizing protein [Thermoplasmata archaeon]
MSGGEDPAGFATLSDLEASARAKVIDPVWAYVQGGAGEERTLRANREAFERTWLRPRVLVDVSSVDAATSFLGTRSSVPFFVAPTAFQGLVHPDAEAATARAAASAGVLAVFSTVTTLSMEAIARAAPEGPRWFQLYLQKDWSLTEDLLHRAERAGYRAVVLTVDAPVLGTRDRQFQRGFALPSDMPVGNLPPLPPVEGRSLAQAVHAALRTDSGATWATMERVRESTKLPLVVKGVLTAEDAARAVELGAKGVVVSNHGGRQLDGAPASLRALPEVVRAVGSKAEVYLDSGIRRGSDILAALALGARGVGIGRPVLWALGCGGEAGVAKLLRLLREELETSMRLAGRRSIGEVDSSLVEADGALP